MQTAETEVGIREGRSIQAQIPDVLKTRNLHIQAPESMALFLN